MTEDIIDVVARLRERHFPVMIKAETPREVDTNFCMGCGREWPCDIGLLLDDRDQWREKAERLTVQVREISGRIVPAAYVQRVQEEQETQWQANLSLTAALDVLLARAEQAERELQAVLDIGHNDDCMFCGFKDRIVWKALSSEPLPEHIRHAISFQEDLP